MVMKRKSKTKTVTKKSAPITHHERLERLRIMVWAALTMTSFLIAFFVSQIMGSGMILPFLFGGIAMISIMLIEALFRGRVWIFEPGFRETFGQPDISYRILLFSGALLLIMESYVLIQSLMR